MAGKIEHLAEMTTRELDALDKGRTICVLALSPLEVHGPHLPLGTDVFVAEEVRDRAVEKLGAAHPEYDYLYAPSYYLGSDTIPGSVAFDSRAVNLTLRGLGEFLASRGFRYLLVFDNHGGPRHQIAIAKAANRLYRKESFLLIAPFLVFYRRMVENDPALLERIQAGPGSCGDVDDCHAGLNETSLVLASSSGEGAGRVGRPGEDRHPQGEVARGAAGVTGQAGEVPGRRGGSRRPGAGGHHAQLDHREGPAHLHRRAPRRLTRGGGEDARRLRRSGAGLLRGLP